MFRIVSEGSVASGVRRIEAITGKAVLGQLHSFENTIRRASEILKRSDPEELLHKAEAAVIEIKQLRDQIETMKDRAIAGEIGQFMVGAKKPPRRRPACGDGGPQRHECARSAEIRRYAAG